jgi:hypothetical protein
MRSWRDVILARFPASPIGLTLAADPDGLLREEQIVAALGVRGYDLLTFADPISFRYVYESRYRGHWSDPVAPPALIVRTDQPDLRAFPYDLLTDGRHLTLSLHDILPCLSYPVVRDLFRFAPDLLDRLTQACADR